MLNHQMTRLRDAGIRMKVCGSVYKTGGLTSSPLHALLYQWNSSAKFLAMDHTNLKPAITRLDRIKRLGL